MSDNKIATNKTKLIEQYFSGNCDFGRICRLEICENGEGVDRIVLKFVLPKLPASFSYKPVCVYDLVKEINFTIGGTSIIHFCSNQMKLFDGVIRNVYTIDHCVTLSNNEFLYPIDLGYFFRESQVENGSNNLGNDFRGIRMTDLKNYQKVLTIKLGTIYDIIKGFYHSSNGLSLYSGCCKEEDMTALNNLHMEDLTAWVNYVNVYEQPMQSTSENIALCLEAINVEKPSASVPQLLIEELNTLDSNTLDSNYYSYWSYVKSPLSMFYGKSTRPNMDNIVQVTNREPLIEVPNKTIKQKISHWVYDTGYILANVYSFKHKLITPKSAISKIYIYSESLNKIAQFEIQLDGCAWQDRMSVSDYKLIQQHSNNKILDPNILEVDIDIPKEMQCVQLNLWLKEECNNFIRLEYLYEESLEWKMSNGRQSDWNC